MTAAHANQELANRFSQWLVVQRYAIETQRTYNRAVRGFCEHLGDRPVAQASHFDVRDFLADSTRSPLTVDNVMGKLYGLRAFFDFLNLGGVVDFVVPRFVRPRPKMRRLPRTLTEEQVFRLIGAARNPRDRAMLEVFSGTGCRSCELTEIRVEDINFARRRILVPSKGGRDRVILFSKRVETAIHTYLGKRKSGFLFEPCGPGQRGYVVSNGEAWIGHWTVYENGTRHGREVLRYLGAQSRMSFAAAYSKFKRLVRGVNLVRPGSGRPLSPGAVARVVRFAAIRAGLGKVTSRILRHTFATHLFDRGADIRVIQELLGHSCLNSTAIYVRVSNAKLVDTFQRCQPRGA